MGYIGENQAPTSPLPGEMDSGFPLRRALEMAQEQRRDDEAA
jgi:hypothetical protein